MVGDTNDNAYIKGFFSFDISSISCTIVSATLRVFQWDSLGVPYSLGALAVDHVNFGTLEANADDFSGNTINSNISSTSDSDNGEWKEFDVTSAVQNDINNSRTTSQYRLHLGTGSNNNNIPDMIRIEDHENHLLTTNEAQLIVTYQ